jgi:hypothetical protein
MDILTHTESGVKIKEVIKNSTSHTDRFFIRGKEHELIPSL